ncbi:MAG: GNAT family protein [archaeon]
MDLTTKRLVLREQKMKHVKDIAKHLNNLKVSRYMHTMPYPYSLKDAEYFLKKVIKKRKEKFRNKYEFAITIKPSREVVGGIGIFDFDAFERVGELGYWLSEDHWKKGYMTEAAIAVLDFSFKKLKLRKVKIPIYEENKGSNALARKMGAKLEGCLRKHARVKATGKIHNENIYGLLREEWKR